MTNSSKITKILIVEDEPLEAEYLKLNLQKSGHQVLDVVSTGEEAIDIAEQNCVDFLIVDIVLAGEIDGIETVRLIHEKHDIPTIFVTSYASEDLLARAEQVRPFAYLLKPYRQRELEFIISMSLARVEVERGLLEQKRVAEIKRQRIQKDLVIQEQRLRHSQKMDALGELTSGVAHDYNNMLGVVLGYAELLGAELNNQPKLSKYVHQILQAGERGAKLTNKLLAFSRKKIVDADMLDLNATLLSHQDMLQKTLTPRIKLNLELTENLWFVFIDTSDLIDAIVNLSINAMHATEGKGQLTMQTSNLHINTSNADELMLNAGDYVQFAITDTGGGMDEETKKQVFEPFFSTKGDKGTGLGLSQVYGFVQRCGGTIKLHSELDQGTRFELFFPRFYEVPYQGDLNKAKIEQDLKGNETILIVDDEAALLDLVNEILSQHGYTSFCAKNVEEALNILENNSIDLVLSDIIIPDVDGYELAAIVRKKYPEIKIQLVSGYSGTSNDAIVDDDELTNNILQKPYNSNTLLKNIRQLLDG